MRVKRTGNTFVVGAPSTANIRKKLTKFLVKSFLFFLSTPLTPNPSRFVCVGVNYVDDSLDFMSAERTKFLTGEFDNVGPGLNNLVARLSRVFEQGLDQARASQEPKLLKNNDYLLKVRGRQQLGVGG